MKHLAVVGLLVIVGFGLYANSLNNSFIWDDTLLIVKNPLIKSFDHIDRIFTTSYTQGGPYYRPLAIFSHGPSGSNSLSRCRAEQ